MPIDVISLRTCCNAVTTCRRQAHVAGFHEILEPIGVVFLWVYLFEATIKMCVPPAIHCAVPEHPVCHCEYCSDTATRNRNARRCHSAVARPIGNATPRSVCRPAAAVAAVPTRCRSLHTSFVAPRRGWSSDRSRPFGCAAADCVVCRQYQLY